MALKVLHVIPAVAARYGGPSAAMTGIGRSLTAAGVETLVVTTDADGDRRLDVELGRVMDYHGTPAIFFSRRASESYKWSPDLANWLRAHAGEFDVVHVHAVFSHSSIAAGRASRTAGVPYVVRPLGTLDPWSLDRHAWRKQVLMHAGVGRLLRGAAAMHYTARQEQRLAESRLPWLGRGIVVPLGIDDELFEAEAGAGRQQVVVAMGRLDPKKGVDLLIRAFQRVATDSAFARWRLVLAGDGETGYVESLRRLAATGPARERIEFRGWIQPSERRPLLSMSRLFVLPSQQENFGIAVVEALACGVPALVSPGVNLADDIMAADAGWVSARDVDSLTAALRSALGDETALERCGAHARRFAARFRWPAVAEALTAMYADVVGTWKIEAPARLQSMRSA